MYPVVMMLPAAAAVAAITAAASAAAAVRSYLLKQVPKLHFVFVERTYFEGGHERHSLL